METSYISQQKISRGEEIKGEDIREGVFNLIQIQYRDFSKSDFISISELNQYRRLYLTSLITEERGELAAIDQDVMNAIQNNVI